jgi:hypothetical protein
VETRCAAAASVVCGGRVGWSVYGLGREHADRSEGRGVRAEAARATVARRTSALFLRGEGSSGRST